MKYLAAFLLLTISASAQTTIKTTTGVSFIRTYKTTITSRGVLIRLEVECKDHWGDWECIGELKQPDGKYIIFLPESPADKILDPELLPSVQHSCREMLRLDREWLMTKPDSFVDKSGVRWTRRGQ